MEKSPMLLRGLVVYLLLAFSAEAQTLSIASGGPSSSIDITADYGIEWQQDNEIMIATGNAKAVRGDNTIEAQVLKVFYRKKKNGGTDIIKLDAIGKVKIYSPTDTITGDSATYDFDRAIALIGGKKVVYRSGKDVLTANEQLEYWEKEQIAVARGNAIADHDGKRVRADTLVARFRKERERS
jgi:Uncharacterized protein conserved in bacteria